jgi:hypothetical protein
VVAFAAGVPSLAQAHDDLYLAELKHRARRRHTAMTRQWLTLGHYRKIHTGGYRSEADGAGFFFAGHAGKIDPEAELLATLNAFRAPAPSTRENPPNPEKAQHAQCRFPARWGFLKRALDIDAMAFPDQPCPLLAMWKQAIAPENVTLVYAAAYLNSPASMYGHTFLRLTRATGGGHALIDYIINFAADIDTDNGLIYAVKGLLGGFKGHFYTMPFYVKIQEYSNIESRDLWEYPMTLTEEESNRLIDHVWETRSTHFDYFFLSENCSYFLLGLLEVARPSLRLSDRFGGAVIPVDTVRAILEVPGLVEGRHSRPALLALLRKRRDELTADEREAAVLLASHGTAQRKTLERRAPERQARILDAALDLMRFRSKPSERTLPGFEEQENALLVLRGRTGVTLPEPKDVEVVGAPETGHRSSRVVWLGGIGRETSPSRERDTTFFSQLSLRGAIHEYLDPPGGFPTGAVLEMGHLRLRFEPEHRRVRLDGLDVVHIISATPIERWVIQPAWRAWIGAARLRGPDAKGGGTYGGASAGGGVAARAGRWFLASGMLESHAHAGPAFSERYRVGFGGRGQLCLFLGRRWRIEAVASAVRYVIGQERTEVSYHAGQGIDLGPHLQARVLAAGGNGWREVMAGFAGYF